MLKAIIKFIQIALSFVPALMIFHSKDILLTERYKVIISLVPDPWVDISNIAFIIISIAFYFLAYSQSLKRNCNPPFHRLMHRTD